MTTVAMVRFDMGSVPDWVAATGTVVALLALTIGLLNERKQRRLDAVRAAKDQREREQRAAHEQHEHEQRIARRVTVAAINAAGNQVQIKIHNGSDVPILEIEPGLSVRGVKLACEVTNRGEMMSLAAHEGVIAHLVMEKPAPRSGAAAMVDFVDGEYGIAWRRTHNLEPVRRVEEPTA